MQIINTESKGEYVFARKNNGVFIEHRSCYMGVTDPIDLSSKKIYLIKNGNPISLESNHIYIFKDDKFKEIPQNLVGFIFQGNIFESLPEVA
jgi:hypothetical protein